MRKIEPWQLQMFRRSLKKRLKLMALLDFVGDLTGQNCLLVTCGDNNGALNWHFRDYGGGWTWADVDGENLTEMSEFLGEPVHRFPETCFPVDSDQFDCIVSIDVLEHLDDDQPFLRELQRVSKPGGQVIVTVPNGDPDLLANRIKWKLGMAPEVYGHTRAGYTVAELCDSISAAGFTPKKHGGYSRFFTEMMELVINAGYVFVLARKRGDSGAGQIAPTTSDQLKTHGAAYRVYTFVYPIMWLVTQLDRLLSDKGNNAVIVSAFKQGAQT